MAISQTSPTETLERTSARMSAEDRRRQIIEVAIHLFSQKGFRGTTTKEIAAAAGVNEAIIFRHFAKKSELYSAIIDEKACARDIPALDAEIEKLMEARNDRKIFERIALHILDTHEQDESFLRLLFYSALEGHELADLFFRNQVSERFRMVAGYVKIRIAEGVFRKVDPMIAVRSFFGTILHHAITNRFFNESLGDQKLNISNRQASERFTEFFLTGIINSNHLPKNRK
jgi:AcrR family transcriptional regulator